MSRTKRAAQTAFFSYAQFGVALAAGIVTVPFILKHVAVREYGLWLATGEALAYAGLVDAGVLNVIPWLIAEADGRKDEPLMGSLLVRGLILSCAIGALYLVVAAAAWFVLPGLFGMSEADRGRIAGPVAILMAGTALAYPLRLFVSVLTGLQDAVFVGATGTLVTLLNLALLLALLSQGYGLYALAVSTVMPSLILGAAGVMRAAPLCFRLAPHFSRPGLRELRTIFVDGFGTWLSGWGWKLIYSTNATILAATGRADLAPVFACSTKVGMALMQLSWVPGDSGLVGLAQLKEEAAPDRVGSTTAAMLRLYLFGAGACAVFVLAVNPGLVTLWVGSSMFAGSAFNALLAASILLLSAAHAMGCIASIMGERLPVGVLTLAGGAIHAGLAYLLAGQYGLEGILWASIASHVTMLVPGALYLARKRGGLGVAQLQSLATVGSAIGLAGFAAGSFFAGRALSDPPLWGLAAAALAAAIGYLWIARDLYAPLLEAGSVAGAVNRVRTVAGGWLRASEPASGD